MAPYGWLPLALFVTARLSAQTDSRTVELEIQADSTPLEAAAEEYLAMAMDSSSRATAWRELREERQR